MKRYQKLDGDAAVNNPPATLRADFDRKLAILRDPRASAKLRKVFASSPAQLARAANAAGRRTP